MRDLQVNKPQNPQFWALPSYAGYQPLNLADPNLRLAPPPGAAGGRAAAAPQEFR
jgi:hypothetical protein